MKADLKFDTRLFNQAIQSVVRATKKDGADVLNRALKNVAFRAASFTPRRYAADIEAELRHNNLALRIVSKRMKGSSRKVIREAARKLIARRKQGSGAERAGWIPAIQAFGGTFRGAKLKSSPGSMGSARRATPSKLTAEMVNHYYARLSGKAAPRNAAFMRNALQKAILHVANENLNYAKHKIAATLRRYSR